MFLLVKICFHYLFFFCVVLLCFGSCLVVLGCVCLLWVVFGCFGLRYVALGFVQSFLLVLHCLTLFFFVLSVVVSCCFRVFRRLNCFVSSSCVWSFRLC